MFRIVKNAQPSKFESDTSFSVTGYGRLHAGLSEEYFEESVSEATLERKLSRTSLLLLEYKEFLAARSIQRHWRGYFTRFSVRRRIRAAITIQRWWRGFHAQRSYFKFVENKLQQQLLDHYNGSATKIQAFWRGYFTRENVHDMHSLKRLQVSAAQDLLHCVAFKLHHLLRTYNIPGVYSLRNSHCLSKVEKLLASMHFRFHNDRIRAARMQREDTMTIAKRRFKESAYVTQMPYAGPNYHGHCAPKCEDARFSYEADKRMYKIIAMYEEATNENPHARRVKMTMAEKRERQKLLAKIDKQNRERSDFCGDVIKSMRRWNILNDSNRMVDQNIFRNPENLDSFLSEIQSYVNLMEPCHCRQDNIEQQLCP